MIDVVREDTGWPILPVYIGLLQDCFWQLPYWLCIIMNYNTGKVTWGSFKMVSLHIYRRFISY